VKFRSCFSAAVLLCINCIAASNSRAQGVLQSNPQGGIDPPPSIETRRSQPSGDIKMQYVIPFFEQMSQDRKHRKDRVDVMLRDGTQLEGRIVFVDTDRFILQADSNKQKTNVNFSDLAAWELTPLQQHVGLNILELAGLELLRTAMLPVTIAELLRKPCGC
jgi:sRNA-binding regulator protein Hfq